MIFLWGELRDTPLAMVHSELSERGAAVLLLDQRHVLDTELDVLIDDRAHARIRIGGEEWNLDEVTAAYARPPDPRSLPEAIQAGAGSPAWRHAAALNDALCGWLELTDALVVNRSSAMASNNCKPLQAMQIRSFGFQTPDTLITTDADAAKAFWAEHGAVIYKSISGVRSIVARLTETHMQRMDDLAWCPTQFQQYVPGDDYRVHVVGDEVFACRIECEADDYRYASRQDLPVAIEACELPPECAERCRLLACSMGLVLAGVDLRLRPDGRWFCFEVNPSPAFSYYENATGQPIAAAVATLLMRGNADEMVGVKPVSRTALSVL
jgi:RimK-like ATP-grasp domain